MGLRRGRSTRYILLGAPVVGHLIRSAGSTCVLSELVVDSNCSHWPTGFRMLYDRFEVSGLPEPDIKVVDNAAARSRSETAMARK